MFERFLPRSRKARERWFRELRTALARARKQAIEKRFPGSYVSARTGAIALLRGMDLEVLKAFHVWNRTEEKKQKAREEERRWREESVERGRWSEEWLERHPENEDPDPSLEPPIRYSMRQDWEGHMGVAESGRRSEEWLDQHPKETIPGEGGPGN